MKKAELVFIPSPGAGHLVSTVELAKLLVDRDDRLFITVLVVKFPLDNKVVTYTESLVASNSLSSRIKFINLPNHQPDKDSPPPKNFFFTFIENQKPHVKEAVTKLTESPDSPQLAGFVLDMFCTCMIDVANEFEVPSYIFFTSGAAFLGCYLHVQALHDKENLDTTELEGSDAELEVPSLVNSFPSKFWPSPFFDKELIQILHELARRSRGTKGIMVNTFEDLESYAIKSFSDCKSKTPPVYAVGPVLNLKSEIYNLDSSGAKKKADIMRWLDDQPKSSVVFLCFGSGGSFGEDQVKEIAFALEQGGSRFLWSLRWAPSNKDRLELPSDSTDPTDVLPEDFLDRTAQVGRVIGWAPQVAVLGHPAIGGFVSHCGWNSTLESMWFGVPIATWPIYSEQQFNAFELVVELGLAAEIKMDYRRRENPMVVSAEEIERGIRCVMEPDSEMRKRVKEMSKKARKALADGGSSFTTQARFIDDVLSNIA